MKRLCDGFHDPGGCPQFQAQNSVSFLPRLLRAPCTHLLVPPIWPGRAELSKQKLRCRCRGLN